MGFTANEKHEIIRLVEGSDLPAKMTLAQLGIAKSTFYDWFISESSVYRILQERGLITSPTQMVMKAADRFKDPPVRINELWQTDFSYLKVVHWGWYSLTTVLDDYSRYIIRLDHYDSPEELENQIAVFVDH